MDHIVFQDTDGTKKVVSTANRLPVDATISGGGGTGGSILVNPLRAATSTNSNVAGSASSVTLLAANTARIAYSVYNDSTAILYLLEGAGPASTTNYKLQVAPGGLFLNDEYTGIVTGIWASAAGAARVSELTP